MSKLELQPVLLLRIPCLVLLFFWVLFPHQLHAATLTVGPGQEFSTIQLALDNANTGDIIQVYPNPSKDYQENITLKSGVIVEGIETARAKIVGTGTSGDTVTVVSNSTIRNMTIINTVTGSAAIFISGVTGASVTNNLIVKSNTGIKCVTASNLTITNNAIDGNTTGITCAGSTTMTFENNIVSNNTTGIDFSSATVTGTVNYNDVYNNGTNSYTPGANDIVGNLPADDPKFVDLTMNDYHLQTGSACLDAGDPTPSFNDKEVSTGPVDHSRNDCGAYGGPNRDTTPFQVQNVMPTPGTDSNSITLAWDANLAYDIANYEIYFDNRGHTITNNIPSPPYGNSLTVTATVTNCPSTSTPPSCTITIPGLALTAPPSLNVEFGDQELFLNWSPPSPNANLVTSYNVYYKKQTDPDTAYVFQNTGGNVTSYTLTGLTNFTTYDVKVTAVESPTFFINVTALDDYTTPHESNFLDPAVVSATISCSTPSCESPYSNVASNTPQPIAPFPDLPNQGHCFIATAAYGSPWEPQVRILRAFRDEYLEHYDWGRHFIAWYYHHSPPWAQYLNEHVGLKPAVRIALAPAVGIAYFFVETTEIERLSVLFLLMLCLIGGMLLMAKTRRRRG
jgi:Fibronectin type III domain/Periplasmic copper-binding protein (NosD)